jgi:hypothetical protein
LIDWCLVFTSSLCILGASVVMAAFSYHDWLRRERGQRLREMFKLPSWKLWFSVGMLLFCAGWGMGRGMAWWERVLWGVLALWFGWDGGRALRPRTKGSGLRTEG